ncbi:hypothetical protein [Halopiger djelfimassiliensis]|uniref:hypothetical protein n=1 Tax=Halopiger djelfimassiliensis TaxID=1293047 RepID=UPI0006780F84|nr:hypothetical protein [Halopiger djelfimassiliensis]
MEAARLREPFDASRRNAILGWALVTVLSVLAIVHALAASYRWFVFTALAVVIVLIPTVSRRDPLALPSWKLLVLVSIPVVDATMLGETFVTAIAVYVAVATVALVVVVEIHRFTAVRMTHTFATALVVMTTLAVAATWNVLLWLSDAALGTSYIVTGHSEDAANHAMMIDFVYAAVAGLFAGFLFDRYVMAGSGRTSEEYEPSDRTDTSGSGEHDAPDEADVDDLVESTPSLIRGRLNASERTVGRISRVLQLALGVLFLYGLLTLDVTTIANAGIALSITFLPGLLKRDFRLPLEPELVLWITGAVFLHALGSAGLYDLLGQWDSLTHTVSASIVAATGYAAVRAIDLHTDEIYLPPKMLIVFILLFVVAFGVIWELMEFGLGLLAHRFGSEALLAQRGIGDTIGDLFYDLVGAVVVSVWGTVYLTGVSRRIASRLGG